MINLPYDQNSVSDVKQNAGIEGYSNMLDLNDLAIKTGSATSERFCPMPMVRKQKSNALFDILTERLNKFIRTLR